MRASASPNVNSFCRAAGTPVSATVEYALGRERVDHVWIGIDCGERIRVSVNTLSFRNREAGFDPRIRVGRIRSGYEALPEPGLYTCAGLDYRELESVHNVFYETYEQGLLEDLLLATTKAANFMEAWGEFYQQDHSGLHQVHCRRSSCAVPEELDHCDGALRFYFPDRTTTMLLLKFCGQT